MVEKDTLLGPLNAYPVLKSGDAIATPGLVSSAAMTFFEGGLTFASVLDLCQLIEAMVLHDRVHYPMLSEARDLKPLVESLQKESFLVPWFPESYIQAGLMSKEELWSKPGEAARRIAILSGWQDTWEDPSAKMFRGYHARLAEFCLLKRDYLFEYLFRSMPTKAAAAGIERCLSKGVHDCESFMSRQSRAHQEKLSNDAGEQTILLAYWNADASMREICEAFGITCYRSVLEQPFSDRENLESASEWMEPVSGALDAAYTAHFRTRIGRATSLIPAPPIAGAVLTETHCRGCLHKSVGEWRERLAPLRQKTKEIQTSLAQLKRGTRSSDAREFHLEMGEFEAALKAAAERLEQRFTARRKLVYRISEFIGETDSFFKLFLKVPTEATKALIQVDTSNIAGVWNIVSQFDQIQALQPIVLRLFEQELSRESFRSNAAIVNHLRCAFGLERL